MIDTFCIKLLPQYWHRCCRSPVCKWLCRTRLKRKLNLLPHCRHSNGFWTLCPARWLKYLRHSTNVSWHSTQVYLTRISGVFKPLRGVNRSSTPWISKLLHSRLDSTVGTSSVCTDSMCSNVVKVSDWLLHSVWRCSVQTLSAGSLEMIW